MAESSFGILDWAVLLLYLGITVAMGFFFNRKIKNLNQYLFGGGTVVWWAVGISLIATSLSSTSFLGPPEYAFRLDMTQIMYQVGALISIILSVMIFIPFIRKQKAKSAYEILEIHFDGKTRMFAACIYMAHVLIRVGILLFGPALVVSEMMGIEVETAIIVIGIIAIVYTYFGGMEAVIWTDVMQFVILFGSSIFIFIFLSSGEANLGELWGTAKAAGHTKMVDFTFDLSKYNNIWTVGVLVFVIELAVRTADQQFVQRYLSCKDIKSAQRSALLSWGLGFVMMWVFLIIGALLYAFYLQHPLPSGEMISSKKAFPHFIIHYLPSGVTGLLVAGLFAAAMSSLDSGLTALSNTFSVDFLKKFKPNMGERQHFIVVKTSILIFGVLGVAAGLYISNTKDDLLTTALKYTALFLGPLLGLFILARLPNKLHGTGVFIGTLLGALALVPFKPNLVPKFMGITFDPIIKFAWPMFPLITCAGTVLFGLFLGTLLQGKWEYKKEQKSAA